MHPGFLFPRLDLPSIPTPFSLCTLFLRTSLILRFFVSSVRNACPWTSLVLRFSVSSVHQILQLCFAGSAILCQFSTLDPAFVLRWFYDSLSVQYVRFRKSVTALRWFYDSSSVPYIRFRDPAFVLRWFYDSLSVQYIRSCFQSCKCASPILRFCVGSTSETVLRFRPSANSSILCWLRESCCGFR